MGALSGGLCSGGSLSRRFLSRGSLSMKGVSVRLRAGGTLPTGMHSCL